MRLQDRECITRRVRSPRRQRAGGLQGVDPCLSKDPAPRETRRRRKDRLQRAPRPGSPALSLGTMSFPRHPGPHLGGLPSGACCSPAGTEEVCRCIDSMWGLFQKGVTKRCLDRRIKNLGTKMVGVTFHAPQADRRGCEPCVVIPTPAHPPPANIFTADPQGI